MTKIGEYLNEGMTDNMFKNATSKIEKLTNRNDHAQALIEGANLMLRVTKNKGYNKYIKIFEAIKSIQMATGDLPFDLKDFRYRMSKELWANAKKDLPESQYEMFHGSY